MPAVSTSVKREPSGATSSVSTASLVVPLTGLTIARCSPVCSAAGAASVHAAVSNAAQAIAGTRHLGLSFELCGDRFFAVPAEVLQ